MNLFLQPRSQPLIIAHRGSSAHAPENTLAAFQLAAEQGADAIELDVDLTRDGHAIIMHDATIDRTTDGSGAVNALTLEEIRRVDAGAWKSAAFKGERVPLLAEVFAAVGQRVLINVEVKSTSLRSNGVEAKVAALVQQHDLFERVIISSFNPFALRRIKQIEPRLACGLLYAPDLPIVFAPCVARAADSASRRTASASFAGEPDAGDEVACARPARQRVDGQRCGHPARDGRRPELMVSSGMIR